MKKMLTNKQISEKARGIYRRYWGQGLVLHFYLLFVLMLILATARVFELLYSSGTPPFNYIKQYVPRATRFAFLGLVGAVMVMFIYIPTTYMLRRYFIGMISSYKISTTRQFFGANLPATNAISIKCAAAMLFLKICTLLPAALSSYIVYRCAFVARLENLSKLVLIVFMLSLGFTLVWLGFWIKYCISLSLTRYIVTLSPKMNIFDACDLSCRIMDSKHLLFISFWVYNLRYLVLCVLVFPTSLAVPFVKISYTLFVKELLGQYWQDKYPLMIERWRRRSAAHI